MVGAFPEVLSAAQELQMLLISPTYISLQLRSVLEVEGPSSQTHSLSEFLH